jgi:type IV pilus assembly protein PilA
MKKILFAALALSLVACGPKLTARERYVQALNHRLDGNPEAYFDEMLALAKDEPETRAGRRARATIQSGGMMTQVAVVGVLAAIAIPNFLKYQSRAKQSEAKTNLKGLWVAQKSHFAETGRYCTTFQECGWEPEKGARYIYLLGSEALGGDAAESYSMLRMRASAELTELGIQPEVRQDGFLLVAVGNIDSDTDLDVWTIGPDNVLNNVKNDAD